jgi:hypothetical protein
MKKGTRMERLKKRKRAREKRQRWRRREKKRVERMMAIRTEKNGGVGAGLETVKEIQDIWARRHAAVAEEKMGELAKIVTMRGEVRIGARIKNGCLKLWYPPAFAGDTVVAEVWWWKVLRKIVRTLRRGG